MSELSPAAKAVLEACGTPKVDSPFQLVARGFAAATLRAAADQVVPEPDDAAKETFSIAALRPYWQIRDRLLAIATELEAQ